MPKQLQQLSVVITKSLLALLVILIPSNEFLYLDLPSAYSSGIRIDYLLPKVHLSDIVIAALFGLWLITKPGFPSIKIKQLSTQVWVLGILVGLVFIRQWLSINPVASLFYFFKIVEFSWLGWYLTQFSKNIYRSSWFIGSWVLSLGIQSVLAILQFAKQGSVVGYWFLGEPKLQSTLLTAHDTFNHVEKILPYGTTPHPNILAGFLTMGIVFLLLQLFLNKSHTSRKMRLSTSLVLFIAATALGLTKSYAAFAGLILGGVIIWTVLFELRTSHNLFGMAAVVTGLTGLFLPLLTFVNQLHIPSLARRALLNQSAIEMFWRNPIWGVGLNTFTSNLANFNPTGELYHFFQPAHHVLTLLIAEGGLSLLIILVLLGKTYFDKLDQLQVISPLLYTVLPLAWWDHYIVTTQQGQLLLVFTLVLSLSVHPVVKIR